MNQNPINVVEANLARADHQAATVQLVNAYAIEPIGGGRALSDAVAQELIPGLRAHPTTMVFIAFHDATPAGIAVCFRGFSTFAARPLLNIHDFYVSSDFRGQGVGKLLLNFVAERARAIGCCKLTLEVKEKNHRARAVYAAAGFAQVMAGADAGGAIFLTKPL